MCRSLVASALLLALFVAPFEATGLMVPNTRRPSQSDRPAVSCDELLSVVFPALRDDPVGESADYGPTAIPVRKLASDDEPAILEGVTEVGACLALTVPDVSDTRYLLYVEVSGELVNDFTPFTGTGALVAVIDAGPSHELLDLVEVKGDRETDIWCDGPWSRLGPGAIAFIVTNSHHNSSQNYHSYEMLTVNAGRVRPVATVALLNWGTAREDVAETPVFRVVPRRGSQFADVVVTVTVERKPYPGNTEGPRIRRSVRRYRETYRWRGSERGYEDAGGTLDRVDWLNAENY